MTDNNDFSNIHEHIVDMPYEEVLEYSEIIYNGFKQTEIERLEAYADAAVLDAGDGKWLRYKGFNPDVEPYTPGVDDDPVGDEDA